VPDEGGDTFYLSLERAWWALSPAERAPLYGLHAVHDYERAYAVRGVDLGDFFGDSPPVATHPLVLRHPESGRTVLFVSEHVFGIEGMAEAEARPLLDRLMAVCTDPDNVYRHRWSVGDLLIWDNRSTLHRAQGFDPRHPRVMRHVRVAGFETPIPADRTS
jgi:taurine dioxygenase